MIGVPVYNAEGRALEPMQVDENLLGGEVKYALLRQAAVMYEARRHVGTKRTLSRGMVAGSGHKLYRQKGTGLARAGTRKVVHRRGGGMASAIDNPGMGRRLPRKARRSALRSALLSRLLDGEVLIIEPPELDRPRTKQMADLLEAIDMAGTKVLLVTDGASEALYKSARNIDGVSVRRATDLNALEVLLPERVVFTRSGMAALLEGLR